MPTPVNVYEIESLEKKDIAFANGYSFPADDDNKLVCVIKPTEKSEVGATQEIYLCNSQSDVGTLLNVYSDRCEWYLCPKNKIELASPPKEKEERSEDQVSSEQESQRPVDIIITPSPSPADRLLVTQDMNGLEAGESILQRSGDIDEGVSRVFGTSVYAKYNEGRNTTQSKASDDKIIIGYTHQRLPFQIVVDGFYGGERVAIFNFIDQHVLPLINETVTKLCNTEDTEDVIKALINQIYELRSTYARYAEFTLSLAITYDDNVGSLLCVGFGIGDTGLVHKSSETGEVTQLVNTTEVNGFKDAFCSRTETQDRQKVIDRNSVFLMPVNAGDEIVGYTYLPKDSLLVLDDPEEQYESAKTEFSKYIENLESDSANTGNNDIVWMTEALIRNLSTAKNDGDKDIVPYLTYILVNAKQAMEQANAAELERLHLEAFREPYLSQIESSKVNISASLLVLGETIARQNPETRSQKSKTPLQPLVKSYHLAMHSVPDNTSLFDLIQNENEAVFLQKCATAAKEGSTEVFGDDFMIGTRTIPSNELRRRLLVDYLETAPADELYEDEEILRNSYAAIKKEFIDALNNHSTTQGQAVLDCVEQIESRNNFLDIPSLTSVLLYAKQALDNPTLQTIQRLNDKADHAQGKPSLAWKALGGALTVLGVAIGAIVLLACVGVITLTMGIGAEPIMSTVMGTAGVATFTTGITLFKKKGCRSGLSKKLKNMSEQLEEDARLTHKSGAPLVPQTAVV